ncbi:MAG: Nif3-like dinuclear metal center hexameric protein [Candidatus Wildermuthbacteria bacterium]|nr:Nif3-like dinuclear metal center hexameric protein [Candidatus Wildermuthbacteria bacterium]
MTIQDIYNLAVQKGIEADFRTKDHIQKLLARKKQKFEKLNDKEKRGFDQESLTNPYSDSRVLHVAQDKEIKKVLVGIDIDVAEILLAKELEGIDLVISHHPIGRALADLHEVMELQVDVLNQYGVPVNIAEGLLKERISEVARGINPRNNWRTVDAAKLLGVSLMCLHTVADNNAAAFVRKAVEAKNPERLQDLMEIFEGIAEYEKAVAQGSGPRILVGSPENRCGKIAITEMTGGTEGSPKLYERMAQSGIGTVIAMHLSDEHKKEAETSHINVINAGHMSSDSIGMNLIVDELEKQGIEIVPCGGFLRVSRLR